MCGIVYSYRKDGKATAKRVLKRYNRQADRGTDGFGYVSIGNDMTIEEYRRFQDENQVRDALNQSDSQHVLFHHRFPTSTINIPEAAHPIKVSHPELKHTYYVVHNGVISNPDACKKEHDKLGYKYQTLIETKYEAGKHTYYGQEAYNDSEALAVELARTIEGLQPTVKCTGSIAVMALQCNKAGTKVQALYYGTNGGNPLTLTDDDAGIVIASEGGKKIASGVMYRTDFATGKTNIVDVPIPAYVVYDSRTSGYGYSSYNWSKDDQKEEDNFEPKAKWQEPADWSDDDELAELEQALADTKGDLLIAKQVGDLDEIESLEIEIDALQEQIMFAYEGMGGRTIGF